MQPTPQLVLPHAYITDAAKEIRKATRRVLLLTTTLVEADSTRELVEALLDAAHRGVKVDIAVDTFTYTEFKGSYVPTTHKSKRAVEAMSLQKRFREAGAEFKWLGRLSAFAFAGRTHAKWCVVDDTVYSFGGINISEGVDANSDFMLRATNSDLADRMAQEHARIVQADHDGHAYRSHRFGDDDNMVLVDGGFFGDSIIYRRACYWAERAEKVLLVSQYCPTGKLSRLLKRTNTQLYFNHWTTAGFLNRLTIRFGMTLSKHVTSYNRRPYLHAKFIIFTLPDGDKVAITGSHNFVGGGVLLGTREVALETTNKKVIKQLEAFWKEHVK